MTNACLDSERHDARTLVGDDPLVAGPHPSGRIVRPVHDGQEDRLRVVSIADSGGPGLRVPAQASPRRAAGRLGKDASAAGAAGCGSRPCQYSAKVVTVIVCLWSSQRAFGVNGEISP